MMRRDWLLLLLAYRGAPDGLDPVRIQKAMFLLKADLKEALPVPQCYTFSAYNYGPMSKQIYTDLDDLVDEGFVRKVPVNGQSWSHYVPSPRGLVAGERVGAEAAESNLPAAQKLWEIKQAVANKTFDELLEFVYERHPEYEERSIFRRRQRA